MKMVAAIVIFFVCSPLLAADRSIAVNGSCLVSLIPDRAAIVVTADVLDKDVSVAIKNSTTAYNQFKASVEKLGLKDLELATTESTVNEEVDWIKGKSVRKGFRSRLGLRVSTSEINRMGDVIAIAGKQGIASIGQLTAYASVDRSKAANEACLEEATRNARAKAVSIAAGAGVKIGKPLSIIERGRGGNNPPVMMDYARKASELQAEAAPPSMAVTADRYSIDVDATFEIN